MNLFNYYIFKQLSRQAMNVVQGVIKASYHTAKECLDTNYYGVKRVTQELLPLLELSTYGGRIVSVSSLRLGLDCINYKLNVSLSRSCPIDIEYLAGE